MSTQTGLHSALIKSNGDLYTFGNNYYGQLGQTRNNRTQNNNWAPQKVTSLANVKLVAMGYYHTLVLLDNGDLYGMGYNYYGQLGLSVNWNTDNSLTTPTYIMDNVKDIACGYMHSVVLLNNGDVYTFGYNGYGLLGNGTNSSNTYVPRKVAGNAKKVGAGYTHSMYIAVNGDLYACGRNYYGQLGVSANAGTNNDNRSWLKVMGNVKQVAGGQQHTVILTEDGKALACGYNYYGQLGNSVGSGTSNAYWTPSQIMQNIVAVNAGYFNTFLLDGKGDLYACGINNDGQFGNGGSAAQNPVPVLVSSDVRQVATGQTATLIVKKDGKVFAAGDNAFGQMGVSANAGNGNLNPTWLLADSDARRLMGGSEAVFTYSATSYTPSIHKEDFILSMLVDHVENDQISYKISVNGIQRFPGTGYTAAQNSGFYLTKHLPHTYFQVGANTVLIEFQDLLGRTDSVGWSVEKTNAAPTLNLQLSAMQVHKDSLHLGGSIADAEGDRIQYRILVNGVQKYPAAGYTELEIPPASLGYVLNNSDLTVGMNTVKVEALDEFGGTPAVWMQNITKTNTLPVIAGTVQGNYLNVQVTDADNDKVQYRIFLNELQIYPESGYTEPLQVPYAIKYVLPREKIVKNTDNKARVEVIDELGGIKSTTMTFTGVLSGMLFCNAGETFYSDDFGAVLRYLDFGTIVAGQTTAAERVFVKNTLGYPVENIRIWVDQGELDGVEARAEISKLDAPFQNSSQLDYLDRLDHNDKISFYVRIAASRQAAWGGMFNVLVKADPKQS
ncbi:RCC1 domain-containing protein [Paenibacillus tengchongensis]|uniref:RCC1 domain-containing protein n=1 Tax=Paenibacillus tengchongensis TaxID=2608684 RepID=UPI00124E84D7|nr:hypothetical protein [Paenibacillus tengchongensis]